jgi:hypothetical protein
MSLSWAHQVVQDLTKDHRLRAQIAHPSSAGIEQRVSHGLLSQPSRPLVSRTNCVAQLPVSSCGAGALHPRMLIRWHGLASQLATQPAPSLRQHDQAAQVGRRQRRGNAAAAASDDQHVAGQFHVLLHFP